MAHFADETGVRNAYIFVDMMHSRKAEIMG